MPQICWILTNNLYGAIIKESGKSFLSKHWQKQKTPKSGKEEEK